jgi:hypothetical protein
LTTHGEAEVTDDFRVRQRPDGMEKAALRKAGFEPPVDLSHRFAGTGSAYYLCRRR